MRSSFRLALLQVLCSSLLGLLLVSPVSAQSNLIVNGGFETGNENGWTSGGENNDGSSLVGGTFQPDPSNAAMVINPHSGSYQLIVGAYISNFTLSQQIAVTAGATYNFSFWINYLTTDYSDMIATAQFGSSAATSVLWTETNATATNGWAFRSALFTAPSGASSVALTLYMLDETFYYAVDDLSMVLVVVPTPVTSVSSSSSSTGRAASSVRGDPTFVGLLGQSFQVHGIDQQVYSLIRDNTGVLVNSRFVFLSEGVCPAAAAVKTACWSHPGSYLGEVGVVSAAGHKLSVVSGAAKQGFSVITVNGEAVKAGASVTVDDLTLTYTSSHEVLVTVGNYKLVLQNSDAFINVGSLAISEWKALKTQQAHGLLGQTWRRAIKRGQQVKEIDGAVDDYAEADNELYGDNFAFVSSA